MLGISVKTVQRWDKDGKLKAFRNPSDRRYYTHHQFLKEYANAKGIIVVNNEVLSPQEEMVQDLINIIHVFSCRIYELRKYKNKIKKEDATRQNIQKQLVKVQKLHQTLTNIRDNYINQTVSKIVKQKPSYITIEDLNVSGMMKNKHLARAVTQQKFYQFRTKLTEKCKQNNIELRVVNRWYPSSKTCSECGHIKKDLKLKDRTFICPECGIILDRDKNASINLANAKVYKIA